MKGLRIGKSLINSVSLKYKYIPGVQNIPHSYPNPQCLIFYILIQARTLDLNFCSYSTAYTSEDVGKYEMSS